MNKIDDKDEDDKGTDQLHQPAINIDEEDQYLSPLNRVLSLALNLIIRS